MKRRVMAMRMVREIGRSNRSTKVTVTVPGVADEDEGDGNEDGEGDRKEEQNHKGDCTLSGR